MRFSLNFIKELLDVPVKTQNLAHTLTMAGMEVEYLEKRGDDWLFDIEVTTNRYDWLSMVGIAREIAACLGKTLKIKYPSPKTSPPLTDKKIIIEDLRDCPLYIGRLIKGIEIGQSPPWLGQRVSHCEVNAINNIVDITNYCMLKWGNPLHAFDADKLKGNIYIRRAKKGETFLGIDDKERTLNKDNLVIADERGVIALAGVMGAKNTEVDQNTKNVFLEAAIFTPLSVRRSRRTVGLDTESSYRFERRVFSEYVEYASFEAAKLMEELAAGKLAGYISSGKKSTLKTKPITISLANLSDCLGISLSKPTIKKILSTLGFKIKDSSAGKMIVWPASFRFDINREVDVFEEISRIYGYSKIEPQIPALLRKTQKDNSYTFKKKLQDFIASIGLQEIITYSIENDEELKRIEEKEPIIILNPLRKQENSLRTTLLSGMIKSIRYNLNRNQSQLRFFEIADIYYKDKNSFCEKSALAIGGSGTKEDFFYFKGIIEQILNYLNIEGVEFKQESLGSFTNALRIKAGKLEVGFLGKLDEDLRKEFDLVEEVFFSQLDSSILAKLQGIKRYVSFSPYPAISRDISIALAKKRRFQDIESLIKNEVGSFLSDLQIINIYKGKDLPKDIFAFTLRVFYQSPDRTLTSQEVDSLHNKIRSKLSQQEGLQLR